MGFENDTYIGTLKICANIRIKKCWNLPITLSNCSHCSIVMTHSCDLWASRCLVEEPRLFDHKCVRRTHDLTHMCVKSAFQSSSFLFILTWTTIFHLSLKFTIFITSLFAEFFFKMGFRSLHGFGGVCWSF